MFNSGTQSGKKLWAAPKSIVPLSLVLIPHSLFLFSSMSAFISTGILFCWFDALHFSDPKYLRLVVRFYCIGLIWQSFSKYSNPAYHLSYMPMLNTLSIHLSTFERNYSILLSGYFFRPWANNSRRRTTWKSHDKRYSTGQTKLHHKIVAVDPKLCYQKISFNIKNFSAIHCRALKTDLIFSIAVIKTLHLILCFSKRMHSVDLKISLCLLVVFQIIPQTTCSNTLTGTKNIPTLFYSLQIFEPTEQEN